MTVTVHCRCGKFFTSTDDNQGRKFRCKHCQRPLAFPRHDEAELADFPDNDFENDDWRDGMPRAPPRQRKSKPKPKPNRKQKEFTLTGGRVYVHEKCGGTTRITGKDFSAVSNSYARVRKTFCAACNRYDYLFRFSWADTGEKLTTYRQRVKRYAQPWTKVFMWVFPIVCGAGVGYFLWSEKMGAPGNLTGFAIGAGVFAAVMSRIIIVGLLMELFADDLYKNE